jgi:hypothetical protein
MRYGAGIEVITVDCTRLEQVAANKNSRLEHVWRAQRIVAMGEGRRTAETMRRAGLSKPQRLALANGSATSLGASATRDTTRPLWRNSHLWAADGFH